jgi:hypothetical protein
MDQETLLYILGALLVGLFACMAAGTPGRKRG